MRVKKTPHLRARPRDKARPGSEASSKVVLARSNWGYHISIKVMLVVVACAMLLTSLLGTFVLLWGSEFGLLTTNRNDFRHAIYDQTAWRQLSSRYHFYENIDLLREMNADTLRNFTHNMNSTSPADLYVRITCLDNGQEVYTNIPEEIGIDWYDTRVFTISYYDNFIVNGTANVSPDAGEPVIRVFEVSLAVPAEKASGSLFSTLTTLCDQLHRLRWVLLLVTVGSFMLVIGLFAICMLVAGRQVDGTVRCNTVDLLPFDVFVTLYVLMGILQSMLLLELSVSSVEGSVVALASLFTMVDMPLLVLLFMSTATRCKCGTILSNTVIWRLLKWAGRFLVWLWRVPLCALGRLIARIARAIPLMWQGLALMGAVSLSTLAVVLYYEDAILGIIWIIAHLILVPLLLYILMSMHKLQVGARRLSEGDLGYRIDELHLFGPLRRHAEYLNDIRRGINRAVDERTRSERFRSELITNVSHDIKTPLTSIINYIDLLQKECEAGDMSEDALAYIEVVERQSLRLKKLIEDLTEASKASTGALTVNLAPCQIQVLLSQALMEHHEKLIAAQLEVVTRLPEQDVVISADGRLLWRVFDNLLSNAAKYSLRGTRLYIDVDTVLTQIKGGAPRPYLRISFRNISGQQLNISPDELMERFVRGDAARHTDGSGLGLSIARSLVELHHGSLDLEIDGDLFKAIVLLPLD